MPLEEIDSLADDVKPLVLELPRPRQAAEDAGQLFAAAVARSEGERRGADAGEESPQRPSGRGASARIIPTRLATSTPSAARVAPRSKRQAMNSRGPVKGKTHWQWALGCATAVYHVIAPTRGKSAAGDVLFPPSTFPSICFGYLRASSTAPGSQGELT
jgi:hypothetical protein